ncbi:hypothetical protein ACFQPF_12060 [Fictibacillus iocasae]|uniref:DUF1963 domain-containing protein n=1 Tax=Fictibacillus iocasae TaxID=2715437 RepID=A0ABW2NT61_9BACL
MKPRPYGEQWRGLKGYRVVEGADEYAHVFGGEDGDVPICKLCGTKMHQIICFDLKDPRLSELKTEGLSRLPFVSCLNCAMVWEPQYFQLSNEGRALHVLRQDNTENWTEDDEDRLLVPLPKTRLKLVEMKIDDIPLDEAHYDTAYDLFGTEYICRLLGAPLYNDVPQNLACPKCKGDMMYVGALTEDLGEPDLISVTSFLFGEMVLYFYLCQNCLVLKTEIQGT